MPACLKCVVVGDSGVGKTCLLSSYCSGQFHTEHAPTVFDTFGVTIPMGNENISLVMFDTTGQENGESVRQSSYSGADVFLVCFSVVDRLSFADVALTWIPEVARSSVSGAGPDVPILLVGTQSDRRVDNGTVPLDDGDEVSRDEAIAMARRIGAVQYVECSALLRSGLKDVFDETVRAAILQTPTQTSTIDDAASPTMQKQHQQRSAFPVFSSWNWKRVRGQNKGRK